MALDTVDPSNVRITERFRRESDAHFHLQNDELLDSHNHALRERDAICCLTYENGKGDEEENERSSVSRSSRRGTSKPEDVDLHILDSASMCVLCICLF